jgi:prepilin-type N-terminal cleavage/methylation domain-containing protein
VAEHVNGTRGERGFTVIEVLIALLVLLVGMAGILSMQLTSVQATGFSRHATEATILGEGKMEELRTMPVATLADDQDPAPVDALGQPGPTAIFTRRWEIDPGTPTTVTVFVDWLEQGGEPYTITLRTQRTQ